MLFQEFKTRVSWRIPCQEFSELSGVGTPNWSLKKFETKKNRPRFPPARTPGPSFIVQPSKFCSVTRFICTRGFQKSNRQILLGYSFCTRGGSDPLVQNNGQAPKITKQNLLANCTVMGGQQVCNQTFRPDDDGKCGGAIHTGIFVFSARDISFWRKIHAGAHASSSLFLYSSSIPFHSHNALNLLSSATDKVNRGGRPPTRRKPAPFRRPAPPRRAACSSAGEMTCILH